MMGFWEIWVKLVGFELDRSVLRVDSTNWVFVHTERGVVMPILVNGRIRESIDHKILLSPCIHMYNKINLNFVRRYAKTIGSLAMR